MWSGGWCLWAGAKEIPHDKKGFGCQEDHGLVTSLLLLSHITAIPSPNVLRLFLLHPISFLLSSLNHPSFHFSLKSRVFFHSTLYLPRLYCSLFISFFYSSSLYQTIFLSPACLFSFHLSIIKDFFLSLSPISSPFPLCSIIQDYFSVFNSSLSQFSLYHLKIIYHSAFTIFFSPIAYSISHKNFISS